MKWEDKKDTLDHLINVEGVSYEEIGRMFKVSGSAIKKAARTLGIELPKRREINPSKLISFANRKKTRHICQNPNCDSQLDTYKSKNKNGARSYYRYHKFDENTKIGK